jgi:cytochrome c-type biogenesis protein CcmF
VSGAKITVGAQYFNLVMVPLFLLAVLLMGIGPSVPWRKANLERLRSRLLIPGVLGLVAALAMAWLAWPLHWTGPVAVGLVTFVFATLMADVGRATRQRRAQHPDEGLARAIGRTLLGNRRHYGGMVVHLGILIIAIGLTGSGLFRAERAVAMAPGDVLEIGSERLRFEGVQTLKRDNYIALQGRVTLLNDGTLLTPERRRYPVQEAPTTEASIDSTALRDVYVVIGEQTGARWAIHVYVNPLVQFIWFGGGVILLGLALSLNDKVKKRMPAPAAEAG